MLDCPAPAGWDELVAAVAEHRSSGVALAAVMIGCYEARLDPAVSCESERAASFRVLDAQVRRDRAERSLAELAAKFALSVVLSNNATADGQAVPA